MLQLLHAWVKGRQPLPTGYKAGVNLVAKKKIVAPVKNQTLVVQPIA
jgi:hypothetical protein